MGWKRDVATWLYRRNLLPGQFIKVYVLPLMFRGKKNPYQSSQFFESYYKSVSTQEFSDRITLAPDAQPLHAKFHYNATENSIIKFLARSPVRDAPAVLDIGSGAGHWIDFWLATFNASFVCGVDVSRICVDALRIKYANSKNVVIVEGDISKGGISLERKVDAPSAIDVPSAVDIKVVIVDGDITQRVLTIERKYDVISAIGVIFHIVEDDLWHQALVNLHDMLSDDGVIVVGGHFGWITQNVQFHVTDDFDNLEKAMKSFQGAYHAPEIYFSKRVRSLRLWKKAALKAGLRVEQVIRTERFAGIPAPENHILVLMKNHRQTTGSQRKPSAAVD